MIDAHEQIGRLCLALPGAYEKLSHGSPCFFVERGKQFAALHTSFHSDPRPQLWVLATLPEQQALLTSGDPLLYRPPYVGHKGWIAIYLDGELAWPFIADLLERGHELASPARPRPSR